MTKHGITLTTSLLLRQASYIPALGYLKKLSSFVLLGILFLVGCSTSPELQWKQGNGYRWVKISPGFWDETGFEARPPSESNINFVNHLSDETIASNRNLLNGSGVAAGDVDGDGLVDLYFTQLEGSNRLYKNMGGLEFKDITEEAGVAHEGFNSTGTVFADVDGDGDLDLLVTSLTEHNALYINEGSGRFRLKKDSGLGQSRGATTNALADIDGDGDLDLYITNYKVDTARDKYSIKDLTLENMIRKKGNSYILIPPYDRDYVLITDGNRPSVREAGEADELYINEGDGTFRKVTNLEERFLSNDNKPVGFERDWGLTAKFQDLNGDGLPDLYVCNDFWTPDRIWINQGDGIFKAIEKQAVRKFSFSSMGVDFSDVNRDGFVDIFVTEMLSPVHQRRMRQFVSDSPYPLAIGDTVQQVQAVQNTLQLNRGDNTFAEMAYYSGVEATGWSWATRFLDIDLDGYEDIVIATGNAYDFQDLDAQERLGRKFADGIQDEKGHILEFPSLELPNQILRNNGNLTFSNKSKAWGVKAEDVSHGMAVADLDNDGDLDLIVNRLNKVASVYENTTSAARIAVRLKGDPPNTQGIGARITLEGGPVRQSKELTAGGDYLSSSESQVTFAAEENNDNHSITVNWAGGSKSTINHVKANTVYEIEEPSVANLNDMKRTEGMGESRKMFKDISGNIAHTHHEENFEDFDLQPLLLTKLSHLGPGVSWIDFDRDGDDDLFITSGKGGRLGVYENIGEGAFNSKDLGSLTDTSLGDQTMVIGWHEEGRANLILGRSIYEQRSGEAAAALIYDVNENGVYIKDKLVAISSATGPLAAADYDGDGDLDLFVGGRFVAGNYPLDASSRLFLNEEGDFQPDKINSKWVRQIGLVTGAVFTDFDMDGDQDLVLSTEWGSLKILENKEGRFHDVTESVGLDCYKGWWNGVATGDFNGDGRPDIIATNMGLNSPYHLNSEYPIKIFYDDFDRDRRTEILEAYYEDEIGSYVPRRQLYDLDESVPVFTRAMKTHRDFARSSLGEILGVELNGVPSKEINTLQHMLFLNEGKRFSAYPLPEKAQRTAAFNAGIADFDNDGNEDIFLTQNFFSFPPSGSRLDAGRGLLLRGDGQGSFRAVPGQESGIKIYGEQRGAALSDIDNDGKVDLAVSQNGAATKLYLNRTEKAGFRVKLNGPPANSDGIGSSIRLVYKNGSKGPRREIQSGSGYWSQNSTIQVMGAAGKPRAIEVVWFDGSVQQVEIEAAKKEYRIRYTDR